MLVNAIRFDVYASPGDLGLDDNLKILLSLFDSAQVLPGERDPRASGMQEGKASRFHVCRGPSAGRLFDRGHGAMYSGTWKRKLLKVCGLGS